MTQATTNPKKLHRKELRQPDEFISFTRRAVDWARANAMAVQIVIAVAVVALLLIAGIRWYVQSRDADAARQFYGANELFKREQWDPALQDFSALAKSYGSTPYGNLARFYAGRAALKAGKPADAIPFLNEFVGAAPSVAFEQMGRVSLGQALEATGDQNGAREQFGRALDLDGPLRPEATIALARAEEAGGSKDKAIELYQKYLADNADGAAAGLARMRLTALGVTPPPSPPGGMAFPGGLPPGMQSIEIP